MAAYGDTEMTEPGRALALKISQQPVFPDGIVAINDALGIGLMAGLHQAGSMCRNKSLLWASTIFRSPDWFSPV
jgi:DNA-binding LacI/PurR family transcriptional regulator